MDAPSLEEVIDEILAIINPQPPEGAFTAQDVAERSSGLSAEYARQLLMQQVDEGVLATDKFRTDGRTMRYFWKVEK